MPVLFAGTIDKVELHGGPIKSSPFERPTLGVSEARKINEREGGPSLNNFFFFFGGGVGVGVGGDEQEASFIFKGFRSVC